MRLARFLLVCLLASLWTSLPVAAAEPPDLIAKGIDLAVRPAFDGTTIAWAVVNPSNPNLHDVYATSLTDRKVLNVATGVNRPRLAVSGSWVVWRAMNGSGETATNTIYGWDLRTATPVTIADIPTSIPQVMDIDGEWVVWTTGTHLMKRSVATMAPAATILDLTNGNQYWSASLYDLNVDGATVVWEEITSSNAPVYFLRSVSINGGTSTTLDTDGLQTIFDVGGNRVVHMPIASEWPNRFWMIDLATTRKTWLDARDDQATFPPIGLTTNGRYVFWGEQRCEKYIDCRFLGAWGYDTKTQTVFRTPLAPLIARNDGIIWTVKTYNRVDLYADSLTRVMPTTPQPTTPPSTDDEPFFPTTGHQLTKPFGPYWKKHGGLAIFGYPLTDKLNQANHDAMQSLDSQYLERQRLEVHPELAGTPYEILLGRLGDDLLKAQGRNWRNEGHDQPGTEQLSGTCETFTVTNRTVCGPFLSYWHAHGLDLGQPGVTAEESLALFGYPLTAPRYEVNPDGDRVLTQWFERARFEYHPQNQEGYKVLLGRLGAELIEANDW